MYQYLDQKDLNQEEKDGKMVISKHGSTEQVGIVTQIYEGQQCYSKQITTCGGIASGKIYQINI